MSAFRIFLWNEQPFYQSGDWLEGFLLLTWREQRQVHGVRLKLSGEEHVQCGLSDTELLAVTATHKPLIVESHTELLALTATHKPIRILGAALSECSTRCSSSGVSLAALEKK